jgi:hypothetical protein
MKRKRTGRGAPGVTLHASGEVKAADGAAERQDAPERTPEAPKAIPPGKLAARESLVSGKAYVVVVTPGGYEQVIRVCPDLAAARSAIHEIIVARAEAAVRPTLKLHAGGGDDADRDGRPSAG